VRLPIGGEHAGWRTDNLRARSGPNLLSYAATRFFSDRASHGTLRRQVQALRSHPRGSLWHVRGPGEVRDEDPARKY
jgi:hypothetical protein